MDIFPKYVKNYYRYDEVLAKVLDGTFRKTYERGSLGSVPQSQKTRVRYSTIKLFFGVFKLTSVESFNR